MLDIAVFVALLQDKVKLELTYKDGYHYSVTKRQSEESDVTIKHDDDPPARNRTRANSEHIYTETILGTAGGLPTRVERAYSRAHDDFNDLEKNKSKSRDLSFGDKKVTIARNDKGSSIEKSDPGITARDLEQLQIRIDPISSNFPTAAMAPGDDWTIAEGALKTEFLRQLPGFTIDKIGGTGRFERIETWNKQRCAVVTAAVNLEARSPQGPAVTIKTDATMWLNLERGVIVRIEATSTQSLGGAAEHPTHGRFEYSGSSTAKYSEEWVWLD